MVVISIVGILLLFSLPVFQNFSLFSDSDNDTADIVRLINDLKKRAVEQDIDFNLHIDTASNTIWVTHDSMNEELRTTAQNKAVMLASSLSVLNVQFFITQKKNGLQYQIKFYKEGYCDFAMIHIVQNDENITLKIEPFLSRVQLINRHVYFDDCI